MKRGLLLLLVCLCVHATAMELKGTVSDEQGEPVKDSPIYLVMKREVFNFRKFRYEVVESKTISTHTDEFGLYQLSFDVDPYFNRFHLYFHGKDYDYARFLRPEPEDVTDEVRSGRATVVNRILRKNPLWEDLQIVLSQLEPDSQRYQILRKYGFPERRDTNADGSETWHYDELEMTFTLPATPSSDPPEGS